MFSQSANPAPTPTMASMSAKHASSPWPSFASNQCPVAPEADGDHQDQNRHLSELQGHGAEIEPLLLGMLADREQQQRQNIGNDGGTRRHSDGWACMEAGGLDHRIGDHRVRRQDHADHDRSEDRIAEQQSTRHSGRTGKPEGQAAEGQRMRLAAEKLLHIDFESDEVTAAGACRVPQ